MSTRNVQNKLNDPVPINLVIQYLPPMSHSTLTFMYVEMMIDEAIKLDEDLKNAWLIVEPFLLSKVLV